MKRTGPFQDGNGRWRLPNGRFMKLGQALATAEDASKPGDGGRQGRSTPRLAKAGSKLTERQWDKLQETFTGPASAAKAKPAAPKAPKTSAADDRVRAAHAELVTRVGDWVSIADLRDRLGDMPRAEQDAALERLATSPGVTIIPWDNRNALDARDHAAALRFGGQDNNAIRIEGVGPAARGGQHPPTPDGVRAAYADIVQERGQQHGLSSFVGLADLRDRIGGTRDEQDAALHALRRMHGVRIIPVADLKALQLRDRDNALSIGGEDSHMIAMLPRPTPASIRAAYAELLRERSQAPAPDAYVSIADLRERLGGTRDEQDAALREIEQHGDVNIVPQANQKALSDRTRAGAVTIGRQSKDFLVIDPNASRTPPRQRSAAERIAEGRSAKAAAKAAAADREARYATPAMQQQIRADADEIRAERPGASDAEVRAELERDYPPGAVAKATMSEFQRGIVAINDAEVADGTAETRRLAVQLDTERRTWTTKRETLKRVEAEIAKVEAAGGTGGARHEELLDIRFELEDDIANAEARMAPIQRRLDELALGLGEPQKPARHKPGSLSRAASRVGRTRH